MKPNNPPAFPQSCDAQGFGGNVFDGISTLDYFAAKAMWAIIANNQGVVTESNVKIGSCPTRVAEAAYLYAAAMLAEREKGAHL